MKTFVLLRRSSQAFFTLFFIYILWSTTYPLKGSIPVESFFTTDPLIMFSTAISRKIILPGMIFAVLIPVLTLLSGRFFCGWICPLGTCLDMCAYFRKNKKILRDKTNKLIRLPKYMVLAVIFILSFAGIQTAWLFDPIVIFARFVSLNFIPAAVSILNSLFINVIRNTSYSDSIYDLYRSLRGSVMGINVHYFSNSLIIFFCFLGLLLVSSFLSRAWCRSLCPLGALYSLFSGFSPFKIKIAECSACKHCENNCRMGAIDEDLKYSQKECILCMDCLYTCPAQGRSIKSLFSTRRPLLRKEKRSGIDRKDFLFLAAAGLLSAGFRFRRGRGMNKQISILRPPGVFNENDFCDQCVRCGNCMKVCPTNALQPASTEAGLGGIWTPRLVPEIGYCEYNCTLCGNVCPTGAIPKLGQEAKKMAKIGTAKVDRSICLAWRNNEHCLVCEEHCPVAAKAIKITIENGVPKPVVDPGLCIGCGICQNKCPVSPVRAIRVYKSW